MKKISLLVLLFSFSGLIAQETRTKVEEGNKSYAKGAFDQAEIDYREALKTAEGKSQSTAQFNLGDALYKQERWKEALDAYGKSLVGVEDPKLKAEIYHNMGNAWMQADEVANAIENYKQALINDPSDEETRQNLAKAIQIQKMELKQKEDSDEDPDEEKDEENDGDGNKKSDQKNDQNKNQEENKDPDQDQKKQESDQDSKDSEGKKQDLDRQNIERLLQALDRQEEKTQKKLLRKKIKAKPSNSSKDW